MGNFELGLQMLDWIANATTLTFFMFVGTWLIIVISNLLIIKEIKKLKENRKE